MGEPLRQAYLALFKAYAKMGSVKVEAAAATTPPSIEVKVSEKIVLGIRIPTLEISSTKLPLNYGFLDTAAAFDEAVTKFRDILVPICRVAEVENTILRLAEELKKTQRLLNALEHLIIPRYQEAIKFIAANLEEREREDFTKLKHVKRFWRGGRRWSRLAEAEMRFEELRKQIEKRKKEILEELKKKAEEIA
jgi:V/A-type H+-transporting ATPase subunit D